MTTKDGESLIAHIKSGLRACEEDCTAFGT